MTGGQTGSSEVTGDSMGVFEFPSVTDNAGKEPSIGSLVGAPPATLQQKDIIVGKGAQATASSTLEVHYVLITYSNGALVESSWSSNQTATFPLSGVIAGWQEGMPGMKEGGRRVLIVPPSLGYGEMGSGPIAPNETLVFVVDLVKVS
ncbi:MAG: FKBP-type peptidylprolyl isomerase [Actinobacteria bacterium]|nr:FKBP-type peptidylprolyl isomerase [Actinomycetota bacterium]